VTQGANSNQCVTRGPIQGRLEREQQEWVAAKARLLADPTTPPPVRQAIQQVDQIVAAATQTDCLADWDSMRVQYATAGAALEAAAAEGHGATVFPAVREWLNMAWLGGALIPPDEEDIPHIMAAGKEWAHRYQTESGPSRQP